jgi:hypothetical protein
MEGMKDASPRFAPFFLFGATGNHKDPINSLVQGLLLKVYVCSYVNKLWAFMEPEVSFRAHRSSSLNPVLSRVSLVLLKYVVLFTQRGASKDAYVEDRRWLV